MTRHSEQGMYGEETLTNFIVVIFISTKTGKGTQTFPRLELVFTRRLQTQFGRSDRWLLALALSLRGE
jgi:hypothetical protein